MNFFLSRLLPFALALGALFTRSFAADVVIVGDALNASPEIIRPLRDAHLTTQSAGASLLSELESRQHRVVVLAPETPLPPQTRSALSRHLQAGGHVVVVGAQAFDYAPRPIRPMPISRFATPDGYRVIQPERKSASRSVRRPEPARVAKLTGPDGRPALGFRTYLRGMDDFLVELDASAVRSAQRSVLAFWARGDSYMDLLAIEIRDTQRKRWFGFVPLGAAWKRHSISFADFLPEGWSNADEPYPLLKPESIVSIGLGTNLSTLWPEKPMSFAIGTVDLAEDASGFYTPTSALLALRLPFLESGITIPAWLFDPFVGTVRVADSARLRRADVASGTLDLSSDAWLCPTPNIEHPGPRMGTDHRRDYVLKFERESRRIPLWEAVDAQGFSPGNVAELRLAAAGATAGANVALFGLPTAAVRSNPVVTASLAETIVAIATKPKIAGITINTTPLKPGGTVTPTLAVVVQNPRPKSVSGRLLADVADGTLRGNTAVTIPAHSTATIKLPLSSVPADFPFTRFTWRVSLETDAGRDELRDDVDVERGLIHALRHLWNTQQRFPDGRISHHYFGDAYGVRAMFAYADLLRRQPERLTRNRDLWRTLTPEAIAMSGRRFLDMLVDRQNEDGSIPMGYGEPTGVYNVADAGQITLAAGQITPLVEDVARREKYLQFCRAFVEWAELFYIDEKLSVELTEKFPTRAAKGETKAGHYGIGAGYKTRNETGPKWVLPDILGVQTLLTYLDPNPEYRRISERNLRFYLDAGYGSEGYFHAEALVWGWLTVPDAALRERIADNLRSTFIATLLKGQPNDMHARGARAFLNGLPLVYYRRFIEDNAAVRAVLLKYVWSFASEDAPNAMRRVAETFPKPAHGESIAAAKQAACGAIWAMELLEPGSSLLRVERFPRANAGK